MKLKLTTKDLILVALFASLTAILSQIIIPLPITPVPINLATLSIFLGGGLLGSYKGSLSQLIYVLLGAVGLPVFAGMNGGFQVLAGPTGGYIIGYIAAAFVIGFLKDKLPKKIWWYCISMIAGLAACYAFGTVWFMVQMKTSLLAALTMCVFPFLIGDALKIALAAFLVKRLDRFVK